MWMMKRVDTIYLQKQVDEKRLTQDEYNKIIATPQDAVIL
jgi:hypothetical protein